MKKKIKTKGKATYQIYVEGLNENDQPGPRCYACQAPRLCYAHLRNKKGYVYLQWKDAGRVRSLYLGKAPNSSPTARGISAARAGARSRRPGKARIITAVRQGKKRSRRVPRG